MAKTDNHMNDTGRPFCPVEKECGACQLLNMPYREQLDLKQDDIFTLFAPYIDQSCVCHPIRGMGHPFYYRNKIVSPFVWGRKQHDGKGYPAADKKGNGKPAIDRGRRQAIDQDGKQTADRNGKQATDQDGEQATARTGGQAADRTGRPSSRRREILCGMYAAHSHRVVPTDSCLIENETAKQVVLNIRDLMPRFKLEPYREDSGTGFLRHAVVRIGQNTGEVLVTLVTNAKQFPRSRDFSRALVERCPQVTTVVQNVNTRQTNVILGESETALYGPGFILDRLCGLSFRISSGSFYQVNPVQAEVLYQRAIEMASLHGNETVIDAYCGTGTIGIVAAKGLQGKTGAARVIGIDAVASAIKDARSNAKHNGVGNADFVMADAGDFFQGLCDGPEAMRGESRIDVVLMDPPRAGASSDFLKALVGLAPRRVVYISCNPKSQSRDVAYLTHHGYRVEAIQPIDMFPHTKHVENIVALTRWQSR